MREIATIPEIVEVLDAPSNAPKARIERRREIRVSDRQQVAIFHSRAKLVCDLLDVSKTGAKLRIVEGTVPADGDPLVLALFDGTAVSAVVRWVDHKHIGLEFLKPIEDLDSHLHTEGLGRAYYGKAVDLQKRLAAATGAKPRRNGG